jgi:predicted nucleic acid-binding protein
VSSTAVPTAVSTAVVDSSAILALIIERFSTATLRSRLLDRAVMLYAPAIIDLEVLHVLRRYVLLREMDAGAAEASIEAYGKIEIVRFPHDPLIRRIWQLRENFTAYDAAYVALAEGMRIPLITLDARLAKAAPPTVRVELIA